MTDPTLGICASCNRPGRVFAVVVTKRGEASLCPSCHVAKPAVTVDKPKRKR